MANVDCPYYVKNWDFDAMDKANRIQAKSNERARMRDRFTLQMSGNAPQQRNARNPLSVPLLPPDDVENAVKRIKVERSSISEDSKEATDPPSDDTDSRTPVNVQERLQADTVDNQKSAAAQQPQRPIDVAEANSDQNSNEDSSDQSSIHTDSTATTVAASDSPPSQRSNNIDDAELAKRLLVSQHILHDYLPTLAGTYTLWRRNARHLFRHMADGEQSLRNSNPAAWSVEKVAQMVSLLPGCATLGERFAEHEINGRALLSLSQTDLCETALRLRHGQAVKVYNYIVMLREELNVKWLLP